ncbi:MAG: phage tail tube protein [Limimaricola soesokkakensis]|uniref:phage tail tube protein n=1 Tax=Limimaricola soesokkakensis TaxID=1343159 RepID=UPI00405A28E2
MPANPSINNYYIGKGVVYWTPEGGAERDLGNVPEFEFTPEIERLAHFSARSGVRTKDREVVIEKSARLRLLMDEWSLDNLAMALMGDAPVTDGTSGITSFNLLAQSEVRGAIRFEGANAIGPQITIRLPVVSFLPNSSINPISDEWGGLEVSGEVLAVGGAFGSIDYREPA